MPLRGVDHVGWGDMSKGKTCRYEWRSAWSDEGLKRQIGEYARNRELGSWWWLGKTLANNAQTTVATRGSHDCLVETDNCHVSLCHSSVLGWITVLLLDNHPSIMSDIIDKASALVTLEESLRTLSCSLGHASDDLRLFPIHSLSTRGFCENGWKSIGHWRSELPYQHTWLCWVIYGKNLIVFLRACSEYLLFSSLRPCYMVTTLHLPFLRPTLWLNHSFTLRCRRICCSLFVLPLSALG